MDRWQWIVDKVATPEDQENLALLARVIEVDFRGRVEREKDLTAFMAARYRWGNKTTRRRAMRLAGIGVLRWALANGRRPPRHPQGRLRPAEVAVPTRALGRARVGTATSAGRRRPCGCLGGLLPFARARDLL